MCCIDVFSVFIGKFFIFFSCKNFIIFSPCRLQSTLRLFEFDMYSNAKIPVTLCNYKPGAWVLYARVIDQSAIDISTKQGIIVGDSGNNKLVYPHTSQ
jgi:hypothetical protein